MVRLNKKLDPSQTGREAAKLLGDLRRLVVGQEEAIGHIVNIVSFRQACMTYSADNC